MKVLVCAATKYGATGEIAEAVADVLAAKGLEVTVIPPEKVGAVEEFDAVVLGSAVYMGQWLKPARELAERQAAALGARPVWLFSGGPVGEPAKPADNPVDVTKVLAATGPATTGSWPASWPESTSASPTGPWPPPSAPKRATSATGPKSGNGRPASPTPCLPDAGRLRHPARPVRSLRPVVATRRNHFSDVGHYFSDLD
jgi:hypothetical protein